MGINRVIKVQALMTLLNATVETLSRVQIEAAMIANFHFIRLIENNMPIPKINSTFYRRIMSSVLNIGRGILPNENIELANTINNYMELFSASHTFVERLAFFNPMLTNMAQLMYTNFIVSLNENFYRRLSAWIRVKQHLQLEGMIP